MPTSSTTRVVIRSADSGYRRLVNRHCTGALSTTSRASEHRNVRPSHRRRISTNGADPVAAAGQSKIVMAIFQRSMLSALPVAKRAPA